MRTQRKWIPKKRTRPRVVHSERTEHITGHKRIKLPPKEKAKRRAEIFERAGGRCEEWIVIATWGDPFMEALFGKNTFRAGMRCPNRATEWSHAKHGSNKCDCLNPKCSIASCTECHKKRHNAGGKPCPKKERVA